MSARRRSPAMPGESWELMDFQKRPKTTEKREEGKDLFFRIELFTSKGWSCDIDYA